MNRDNASYESRGRPVLPINNAQRVTVYKGRVYMAPPGFACMGPDSRGTLVASDGNSIIDMIEIGYLPDEQ